MSKLIALAAALAALVLVVAGCGSSSDDTTGESSETITKADFVKQANSICASTEKEGEAEAEEFFEEEGISENKQPSEEVQEKLAEEIVVPTISTQLEEIRALGFPDGRDGEEAEAIIDSAEEDLEGIEEEPSALFTGDSFAETNKKARAYGLTVCGSES